MTVVGFSESGLWEMAVVSGESLLYNAAGVCAVAYMHM